jgi:hypothetical protein
MAYLKLIDFIDVGSGGPVDAVSWQVALDEEFTQIIDESLEDTEHLEIWHTPLPKLDGSGFYNDLDKVYGRLKIHANGHVSDWFKTPVASQLSYPIKITDGDNIIETTTDELGWNEGVSNG